MGCTASTVEGAGRRRRRGWARLRTRAIEPGHGDASTTGLLAAPQQGQEGESSGGRRGGKVAPEPWEHDVEAPLPAPLGSPSFRHYVQNTAAVDKIVAEVDGGDGSVRGAPDATKNNQATMAKAQSSREVPERKEETRWLRFRGLAIVAAAWNSLFSRHSAAKSNPPIPAPAPAAAAAAARSHS